jgi:antitoxin YefM
LEIIVITALNLFEEPSNLGQWLDETAHSHQPILIKGPQHNGVLISEQDWRSIEETLYLLAIPQMRESILDGLNTPVVECDRELEW